MQFLILVLPLVASVVVLAFERVFSPARFSFARTFATALSLAVLGAETVLIWQPAANSGDGAFVFSPLARLFLTLLFGLTGLALLGAYSTGFMRSGRYGPATLAVVDTVIAALYINNVFLGGLFLVLAGFFSIVAAVDVDDEDEERFVRAVKASVRYLIATVLFGLTLFIALIFLERLRLDPQLTGLIKVIVALAVVAFALRLAIFPFSLWLPDVLEEAPGLSSFLIVGLINVATVVFLVDFLLKNPTLLFDNYAAAQPVMTLGLAGAVAAGLMGLGQNGLGKVIAYSLSAEFGLILFGLASPHRTGLNGAMFTAANLALLSLLIWLSLAVVSYCTGGRVLEGLSGLGRRMPVATVGLGVGFMSLVGLPFMSGFAAKYLILQSAAQEGLGWVLAGGAAVVLSALALFRYYHRIFMGADVPGLKTRPEPLAATVMIGLLVALVLLVGIWPAPVLDWLDTVLIR